MIELKKRKFKIDDNGLLTFSLRYYAETEDEAIFNVPDTFRGLLRRGHNAAEWDAANGRYVVDATYTGMVKDPESGEYDQFEIAGEFREEAIEQHPARKILEDKYGGWLEGDDQRLKFPPTIESGGSGGSGGTGLNGKGGSGGKDSGEPHPFFNLRTYPVYFEVAKHTYMRKKVPSVIHKRKGTIQTSLPSGFQYGGDSEAWFVDAPSISKQGNVWKIVETYKDLTLMKHFRLLTGLVVK